MTDQKSAFHWHAPPDWVWRVVVLLLAVVVLLVITLRWNRWASNSRRQTTDDAYLQSDLTPIAAKVSGYVRSMPVQDFERVHEGQLIAEIVDDDYRATVDQLTASVAAAAAQIEALKAQQELQAANSSLQKKISALEDHGSGFGPGCREKSLTSSPVAKSAENPYSFDNRGDSDLSWSAPEATASSIDWTLQNSSPK